MASRTLSPYASSGRGEMSSPAVAIRSGMSERWPRKRTCRGRECEGGGQPFQVAALRTGARDVEAPSRGAQAGRREGAQCHVGALLGFEPLCEQHHPLAGVGVGGLPAEHAGVDDLARAVDVVRDVAAHGDLGGEAAGDHRDRQLGDAAEPPHPAALREVPRRDQGYPARGGSEADHELGGGHVEVDDVAAGRIPLHPSPGLSPGGPRPDGDPRTVGGRDHRRRVAADDDDPVARVVLGRGEHRDVPLHS